MMQESDPRVKDLQSLAWGLQSLSNKPGSRLPEAHKRAAYKVASKAITLCTDAVYTEEADFVERAAILTKEIEAKKAEIQGVEEDENAKLAGKCYRAAAGGNYVIGKREQTAVGSRSIAGGGEQGDLSTSADKKDPTTPSMSAAEVVTRCTEDPETLRLSNSCVTDADLSALCEGLRSAGASLTLLDLSGNMLADVGIQRLVGALASGMCPKLRDLRLGGNAFGPLGSQMLSDGLCTLRRSLVVHTTSETGSSGPAAGDVAAEAAEGSAQPAEARAAEPAPPPLAGVAPSCKGAPRAATGEESGACAGDAASLAEACVEIVETAHDGDAGVGRSSQVRATVRVPEGCAASAKDLELDISERRLVVHALAGRLLADTGLPCAVDPESAQAAFSRKKRTVTITLQVAH